MAPKAHPLQAFADAQGEKYSDEWLAGKLDGEHHPDSIRLIRCGHRRPSWELAFKIEAVTGIDAHELRDTKFYRNAA